MKMRAPSIPLITVDPYFSIWSKDKINQNPTEHWTGHSNNILGTVTVDNECYRFLGVGKEKALEQISCEINALTTTVIFEGAGIRLKADFTTPILIDDLYYTSQPVSYLHLSYENIDSSEHNVSAKLSVSEELCLNKAGEGRALAEDVKINNVSAIRMGKGGQQVLNRSGDDVRIDWGYLYLGTRGNAVCGAEIRDDLYAVYTETALQNDCLFLIAYDDIYSLMYFGKPIKAYWKKDGKTIEEAISNAAENYENVFARCNTFSEKLYNDALTAGNTEYAEILSLAYRQVMAAHKLVVDTEGNNLYVSKECFSNGCAATVDVTYPSAPLFLLYNTELLKGMLRPIFKFAETDDWEFEFAPHDVGTYPLLNGQAYWPHNIEGQMPVEECGNMLILVNAVCERDNDYSFAEKHFDLLEQWSKYLVKYGEDPENQLCTDDFAGHLSHNVNLSIKAVMGLAGFANILKNLNQPQKSNEIFDIARKYSASICSRAENSDGSYRLAFDRPETFSLKYNSVWDKIWKTELFPPKFYSGEIARYKKEALPYGVPLDSRSSYTKSDWLLWVASLCDNKDDFEFFTRLLYNAYNTMHTRVPLTDWYYADTSDMVGFRNRTVQGGLFIKLLMEQN